MGLSEDADPTLCKLISSLASPKLPDPAFSPDPTLLSRKARPASPLRTCPLVRTHHNTQVCPSP